MGIGFKTIEIASRQGGYIARHQLIEIGLSDSAINRRIRSGDLVPVAEGIFRLIPSDDPSDLLRGALLKLPTAVVSHQAAAHLLEFPVLPRWTASVTVHRRTTHTFPGVLVHRCDDLTSKHVTIVAGLRTATVARTIFDLAAVSEPEAFHRMAEALLIDGRLKIRHLERTAADLSRRGKPGSSLVNSFLEQRSRGQVVPPTVLESRGRRILKDHGLPKPIPEFPLPWNGQRRFDDAYPEAMVAIEWDSSKWHTQKDRMDADRQRDREAAMRGWVVLRFTWGDVSTRPDNVAATVTRVLANRSIA